MITSRSRSSRASFSHGSAPTRDAHAAKSVRAWSGSRSVRSRSTPRPSKVTLRGAVIALTASELTLLHALAQRPGRVLDREQLLQLLHAGAPDEAFDRSIDVIVSRLRAKIEDDPKSPRRLKTVRGVGYMLTSDDR